MFIKCWMNKLIVVCLYNGILLKNKNHLDTSNNKEELKKQTDNTSWMNKRSQL